MKLYVIKEKRNDKKMGVYKRLIVFKITVRLNSWSIVVYLWKNGDINLIDKYLGKEDNIKKNIVVESPKTIFEVK